MSAPVHVLLVTDNDDRRQFWIESLGSSGCRVTAATEELADSDDLEVVVTDRSIVGDTLAARHKQLSRGELGVIAIGGGALADVALPSDASRREIKLACMLLGEVVRLRRQNRKGERTRKVLSQLALSDPLTGLPNRRAWEEELRLRLQEAANLRLPVSLALFDLDHFKQINTQFGHARGDQVLKEAGHTLVHQARRRDYAARLGGDEFGLIVAGMDHSAAALAVEKNSFRLGRQSASGRQFQVDRQCGICSRRKLSGRRALVFLRRRSAAPRQGGRPQLHRSFRVTRIGSVCYNRLARRGDEPRGSQLCPGLLKKSS